MTFDGDSSYNIRGKLLSNSNYITDYDETVSICSCTCLNGTRCLNHETFVDPDFRPNEIFERDIIKRASV